MNDDQRTWWLVLAAVVGVPVVCSIGEALFGGVVAAYGGIAFMLAIIAALIAESHGQRHSDA